MKPKRRRPRASHVVRCWAIVRNDGVFLTLGGIVKLYRSRMEARLDAERLCLHATAIRVRVETWER